MATRKKAVEAKTIKLIDQLRASAAIYDRELERYDELTDVELSRVLGLASADTVARALGLASDDTVARVLGLASADTVARVLGLASDDTVVRVLGLASDGTVVRALGLASADTVARVNLEVPIVENLDQRMYEVTKDGKLNMAMWHSPCKTTHCRAGNAIDMAGEAGYALEAAIGSELAGRYIYEASTGRPAPDFYASTPDATKDIARCAGREA